MDDIVIKVTRGGKLKEIHTLSSEAAPPDRAIQFNQENEFAGSVELTFHQEPWLSPPHPLADDPSPTVAYVNIGIEQGYLTFGKTDTGDPAPVVGSAKHAEVSGRALVLCARPTTLDENGYLRIEERENQGSAVRVFAGYSQHVVGEQRTTALGSVLIMNPGALTPGFSDSALAGDVTLESGDAYAFTPIIPEGEIEPVEVGHTARGGRLVISRAIIDPNQELDTGSSIELKAGNVVLEDGSEQQGARITLLGARTPHSGSVFIESGSGSAIQLHAAGSMDPCRVWLVGDSFRLTDPCTTSENDAGTPGTFRWDQNYLYLCVGPSEWKLIPLQTFASVMAPPAPVPEPDPIE